MVEDNNVPEDEGGDSSRDETNQDENNENESTQTPDIPTPIMGGIQKQSDGYWTAWTGGEPNAFWTALLKETPSSINPTQFRPTSIGSSSKARYYRTQGLDDKFTRKSALITFQRKVMEHLEEYGMDSISYLPSPVDSGKMISIISDHGRYTLKQAREAERAQMARYDTYDHNNMKDAKKFLMASISSKLKTQLHEDCYPEDSFIVMWMCLMRRIGSISISKYDQVNWCGRRTWMALSR